MSKGNVARHKIFVLSKMDNVPRMKLFKIRMISEGGYWDQYKITFPKREVKMEMKEVKVENENEILQYLERYETKGLK